MNLVGTVKICFLTVPFCYRCIKSVLLLKITFKYNKLCVIINAVTNYTSYPYYKYIKYII